MKKYIYLSAAAMTLLAASCSNDDQANGASDVDNTGKTRIALSAGDDQNSFVVTRAGFKNDTRIVARIVSDSRLGEAAKCVRTVMLGAAAGSNAFSSVSYLDNYTRYWDDAYGRNSILSVYAVAVPNKNDRDVNGTMTPYIAETDLQGANTWGTTDADNNKISWTVESTQTTTILEEQDLTYSNNIQETGDNGVYTWNYDNGDYPVLNPTNAKKHTWSTTEPVATHNDGRLYFTQAGKTLSDAVTDAAGHFDKGQMEFNHALTRVQVNLIKGDGYAVSAPFSVTDMQILGQKINGKFDIKEASWSESGTDTDIEMAKWASAATRTDGKTNAATYEAQMLPGYVFSSSYTNKNALQLTVDGNTYYILNSQLRTALDAKVPAGDYTTLKGNRYIFDVTVAKNKIQNITATVVDWNEIGAANTAVDNSHHTFTFFGSNTGDENKCTDVKLWKYEQTLSAAALDGSYTSAPAVANTAYTAVAGFEPVSVGSKTYKTSEFYQDNKTAYHFRSTNAATALNGGNTTFTMNSGSTDYHWGAPMKTGLSSNKLPYSTSNGYLDCIEKGIVAASTSSQINLTEVHMMSKLVIKLESVPSNSSKGDDAKVTLAGAKVTITRLANSGTVDMGSGLITPSTTYNSSSELTVSDVYSCEINVIPQSLVRGEDAEKRTDADYVGIKILTADNNEYYIIKRLSDIVGTAGSQITNMQENGKITRWYPGHKYIYTFNITKTEIKNITATIVGWNDVNAGNTDLDLEK